MGWRGRGFMLLYIREREGLNVCGILLNILLNYTIKKGKKILVNCDEVIS